MDCRDIFTRDLFGDCELAAAFVYCLREAQPIPFPVRYESEIIELRPYEVLIEWDRIERELGMKKEVFIGKIRCLEQLKRITFKEEEKFVRVQFINVKFPIGPVQERSQPDQDIVSIALSRWIEIDLEQLKAREDISNDYRAMVRQVLNRFKKIINDKPLSEINVYDYKEYVAALQKEGTGNCSINDYRRALKASFNRAITGGYLKQNPIANTKPLPSNKPLVKIVERDELRLLFESIQHRWLRNIISFALLSTKRHGEILNLKWEDIDFENKTISIHSSEEYRVKFGKDQKLVLSTGLEELLRGIEADQKENSFDADYVFLDESGKHLTERKVREQLKEAREFAGLGEHVTIHGMRRSAATILKQKGVPTNTIKGILNHGDEKVTNRYLGVPRDDEAAALDKIKLSDFLPDD